MNKADVIFYFKFRWKKMLKHFKNMLINISYGIIFIIFYAYKRKILLTSQVYNLKLMIKYIVRMLLGSLLLVPKVIMMFNKLWKVFNNLLIKWQVIHLIFTKKALKILNIVLKLLKELLTLEEINNRNMNELGKN
jgi:hypothetical protein